MRWVVALLAAAQASLAAEQPTLLVQRTVADFSLEELANVTVTTVSGRPQALSVAPGSVYVISGEDIRRSGAASLPEALRLAPNIDVASRDAGQYAISARGGTSNAANKLLVLIDGRTVYTPLFSGTFWDAQEVMLEDVERIEVISGPGATIWGANAVNGVINVITRSAAGTQGGLITAGAGNQQQSGAVRYGGEMAGGHYRVYARTLRREHSVTASGASLPDGGDISQAGFRADWGQPANGFTLQGDAYAADYDMTPQARKLSGANLLARWNRDLGERGAVRIQAYYDRTTRNHPTIFEEQLDTYDLEVQHALPRLGAHRLHWGFGLRHYSDDVSNFAPIAFLPPKRTLKRNHLFLQDEIALRPDLELTLGAKIESNSYTGREFLPTARIGWKVAEGHFLWAAASRAVRAPSRIDREAFVPGAPPFVVLAGGPDFRSEVSKVYELGYRAQPSPAVSYAITGFYDRIESLRTLTASAAGPVFTNEAHGHTRGVEAWGNWRVRDWFRLSAGFTRLRQSLGVTPGVVDLLAPGSNANDPSGWYQLRASFDLSPAHELDVFVRHVSSRPAPSVPAYTALDARLGWRATRDVGLSLVARNLTDRRHPEFGDPATRAEIPRSIFLNVRLSFR